MPIIKKIRIYDLARDLKQDTKRIIEELRQEGADVDVPSDSVSVEIAEKIRNRYFPRTEAQPIRAIKIIQAVRREDTFQPVLELIENKHKNLPVKIPSISQTETANNILIVELKVDCQDCLRPTQHNLLHSADMPDLGWNEKYQIVRCIKCDGLSFRRIIFKDNEEEINLYPSRIKGRKKLPLEYIPSTIEQIYGEIHIALSNKLLIIATTGMRTLIELICRDQKSTAKNLKDKIDELVRMHLLTLKNANNLHKLRDFGNDAAHEANIQSEDTLNKCMDIIEHLLKDIYHPEIST